MNQKFRKALVSVSDKTGLVEFLQPLVQEGLEIVSTGGTAQHLRDAGISVIDIQDHTGFPEVMGGRVKTLHPRIHMALLARSQNKEDLATLQANDLEPFDLVVVNLYPFGKALQKGLSENEQIEFIDIGGPSMLRSAAKSFERLTVVCDPEDYSLIRSVPPLEVRKSLAAKVFALTSAYDAMVAEYLGASIGHPHWSLGGELVQTLRYGENPQQKGYWYQRVGTSHGLHQAQVLQGKELSYNNLLDLDAAVRLTLEFKEPSCVVVKHNNPCGVATSDSHTLAVELALKADPVSAFGGIVAFNRELDVPQAETLMQGFLECVIAPHVTSGAREVFKRKPNLRVLDWPQWGEVRESNKVRSILGGVLVQTEDQIRPWSSEWKVIGDELDSLTRKDVALAWRTAAHLRSNAIALVSKGHSVGLGMGQVNRVDAVRHALERWQRFHPSLTQVVAASDAFFPFPDSIDLLAQAGVKLVVQPGGSIKDEEVIRRAQELGVTLVLTGHRHFVH